MVSWHQLGEVLISGVASGATYALIAVGLSLVYGISKVFNWAYGSFFTWGAYFAWLLVRLFNLSYPLVFITVFVIVFSLGLLTEIAIVHPLRWKVNWEITTMISTLGLALVLDNVALAVFGPDTRTLPPLYEGTVNVGGFIISNHEIVVFLIAVSLVIVIGIFLAKSRQGMAMRATSQDITGAQIVGIKINNVFRYTFALSSAVVAMGGILLATKYFISPLGGWIILIRAYVIITIGGLGSLKGSLYAAFILGIVEALVSMWFGETWTMVSWFIIMLILLAVRPKGLFGVWA